MAFRRKQDTSGGEQFKFENKGDSLTGVYLGTFDFDGEYGPGKKHLFKTDKGIKVVFGQTHLTQLLEGESSGKLMRVIFDDTKKTGKGRNPMKIYALEIDDEYEASEDEVNSAVEAANSEDDEPQDAEEDETPADEVKTPPVKAKPAATAPSASSQQRVKDLLARAKGGKGAAA